MKVGFGVDWPERWWDFLEVLDEGKKRAQLGDGKAVIRYGDFVGTVAAGGSSGGAGYYPYLLEWEGIGFRLKATAEADDRRDNVRVDARSLACMRLGGMEGVCEALKRFFAFFGGRVRWNKLSRVDMCVDVAGLSMAPFFEAWSEKRVVRRARKWAIYGEGDEGQTLHVGRGSIQCRMYDKLAEAGRQPVKMELMKQCRWSGVIPSKAIRVEFQVTREALKEFGIDSLEDYRKKRSALVEYLISSWLRVCEGGDRRHTDDWKLAECWEIVSERFRSWAKKSSVALKRVREYKPSPTALVHQILGCARTAYCLAQDTGEIISRDALVEWVGEQFRFVMSEFEHETRFGESLDRMMAHRGPLVFETQ